MTKSFAQRTFVGLVICALAAVSAFAGSKEKVKKSVTFESNTTVNGTMVKAGTYELKFDEQTGEVSINDGGKVVATSTAHLEKRDSKARETEIRTVERDNANELVSVTFGGWDQDLVLGASATSN